MWWIGPRARDLGAQGLVITSNSFFFSRSEQLADLAIRHKLPNIHGFRELSGSWWPDEFWGRTAQKSFRWLGLYAGQILKGEEPANLPVQQSTKVELIINFRTAVAIGLQVPPTLICPAELSSSKIRYPRKSQLFSQYPFAALHESVQAWHRANLKACPLGCPRTEAKRTSNAQASYSACDPTRTSCRCT